MGKLKTMNGLRRTYERLLYKYAPGRIAIPVTSTTIRLNCGGRSWSRCHLATFVCLTLLMAFCPIEWVLRFEPPDNIKPAPAYDEQPLSPADTPAPAAHPKHLHHKPKPLHHEQPSLKFDDSDGGGVDPDCEVGTFMRESTHGCIGLGPSKRSKELHRCVSRQKMTGGRNKWTHSVTTSGCKEGTFQEKLLGFVQAQKPSDGGDW